MTIECRTQKQLDAALAKSAKTGELVACVGNGYFRIGGSSSVVARGSSSVVAWESSSVVAWESSSVVARGSSSVVARGSSSVVASDFVAVQRHGKSANVQGGVLIQIPEITTAKQWLSYYGVPEKHGVALLYKAVNDEWQTDRGTSYSPGSTPKAADWDGGKFECGGGLHFAFHPHAAKKFYPQATRFVACPVKVSEIVVHEGAVHPTKIKAPRVVAPGCFEVDAHGNRIPAPPSRSKAGA